MFGDLPNSYDAIVAELPTVNGKPENWYQEIAVESEKYKQPEMQEGQVNTASNMNAFNQEIAKQEGKTDPFSQEWIKNETQATKTPAPDDYLSSIFGPPPQPKYDQARQDRIKQISKVNAIGEGLKSIGDIFSLATGANVMARQPDQDARQMYVAWQNYEDMYANRMDEYNRQLWNQQLQNLYHNRAYELQKKQLEREEARDKLSQSNVDRQFSAMEADREERRRNSAEDNKLREKQIEASIKSQNANTAQGWEQLKIAKQRADADEEYKRARANGKVTEDKNMIILSGASINDAIKVDKRYRDKILSLIVSDTQIATEDLDLLTPRMGAPVTTTQKDFLIAKYWQQSPAVQGWLRTGEAQSQYKEPTPTVEEAYQMRGRSINPDWEDQYKYSGTKKQSDPFDF